MGCDPDGEKQRQAILTADADADGFSIEDGDCNDAMPEVFPDAEELCDGLDNDCDTVTDEGTQHLWYLDGDGDGYGNPSTEVDACDQPAGYIPTSGDCDDNNPFVSPDAEEGCDLIDQDCDGQVDEEVERYWFEDKDQDGYGDPDSAWSGCDAPEGYVNNDFDCDDTDERMNSLAEDICDSVDNDCDGVLDEDPEHPHFADNDNDGFGDPSDVVYACEAQVGRVPNDSDCDDTLPSVFPGAAEYCNAVDDDCDLAIDEGEAIDALVFFLDDDNDGFGGTTEVKRCEAPTGYTSVGEDCLDTDSAVFPGADEYCNDADDDCDDAVDESGAVDETTFYVDFDGDGYGDADFSQDACDAPTGWVSDSTDCDDSRSDVNPGELERCDDIDNDCDGDEDESGSIGESTWYTDNDGDSYGDPTLSTTACDQPGDAVDNDEDCDDSNASVSPDATEVCDSADNDCDGTTDENDATDALTWYADGDTDTYGDATKTLIACDQPNGYVSDDQDCDDGDATIYPGAHETWYDGVDSDCDDWSDYDADTDGFDSDQYSGTDCDDTNSAINTDATEVCDDGVDDDCSGVADDGCVEEHCGNISSSETWAAGDHELTCDVEVLGGATLTIEDGAKIAMHTGTRLIIGDTGAGELYADGSSAGIYFTSAASSPAAGDWDSVFVGSKATGSTYLNGLNLEYGGSGGACLEFDASVSMTLSDSTVQDCSGYGIYVDGTVGLDDISVTNASDCGVYVADTGGLLGLTGTLSGNGSYPISIPISVADQLDASTSSYKGNTRDSIELRGGAVVADLTLPQVDVDYRITDDVHVYDSSGPQLTFDQITVEMASGVAIGVGQSGPGDLQILTSTVTSDQASPLNGDWSAITLGGNASSTVIQNSTIEYGGGGTAGGMIECDNAGGNITNSVIQHSATYGIYTDSTCGLTLSGNTYANNTSGDTNF